MRRIALLSLTTLVSGCGFNTWWNPPFTTGTNPNAPVTDSVNISRARGEGVAVRPLVTESGDIWPGPLPPPRSLQDLQRQSAASQPSANQTGAQKPTPGSPLNLNRSPNPLTAPLPGGTAPARSGGGAGTPGGGPGGAAAPPVDRRIIVPNGNGTSTVIHPDGRIETIPTPPQ